MRRSLAANAHLICGRRGNGASCRKKVTEMNNPENPYPKGTLIWSVMEGDWEDLDAAQIAEVLATSSDAIHAMISRIKKETGYSVPHTRRKAGRKLDE